MGRLQRKVALITGAARGQGEAEARLFAAEGARVFMADILDDEGRRIAGEISDGGRASYHRLDVTSADDWRDLINGIERDAGRLDILVNNAGANVRHALRDTSRDEWDRLLSIDLTGQFLGIQACAPLMIRSGGGSIVNLGSTASITGHPVAGYSTAKWGVRGLTKAAAIDLAPSNIRVNALHPGVIATPMMDPGSEVFQAMVDMTPLGRAASAAEMAEIILFLAGDQSAFITGTDLVADGGFSELGTYDAVWERLGRGKRAAA